MLVWGKLELLFFVTVDGDVVVPVMVLSVAVPVVVLSVVVPVVVLNVAVTVVLFSVVIGGGVVVVVAL